MIIDKLQKAGVIHPPKWMSSNIAYMVIMGSAAYGVNQDDSDQDIYGFCIPPKGIVFPHTEGIIQGFGNQGDKFNVWTEHHIKHPDDAKREYDFAIYNIVKYFSLIMENNPNMIDSLFVPANCVIHATSIGQHVRENRKMFLHKGAWHKFKGYAFSQMGRIKSKKIDRVTDLWAFEEEHGLQRDISFAQVKEEDTLRSQLADNKRSPLFKSLNDTDFKVYARLYDAMMNENKRLEGIKRYSYDVKFAYHVVRLMNEVEQIMIEGDIDLLRSREQLKSIRRGEWTLEQLEDWFVHKEKTLESVYAESKLPYEADESKVKALLLECLEMHYGSLDKVVAKDISSAALLNDLETLVRRYGGGRQ